MTKITKVCCDGCKKEIEPAEWNATMTTVTITISDNGQTGGEHVIYSQSFDLCYEGAPCYQKGISCHEKFMKQLNVFLKSFLHKQSK